MKRALSIITTITIVLCLALPEVLLADDTEIYGTVTVSLQPNVLIIFDTSGSMGEEDIPSEYYNLGQTYEPQTYTKDAVYEYVCTWDGWSQTCDYYEFASSTAVLNCSEIETALDTNGFKTGDIYPSSGSYNCGSSTKKLYVGNYLNYNESGYGELKSRISVAKDVIKTLIQDTANVRFGLMRFNDNQGGRIVAECGTDKATLISAVDALTASGWTPLGETLAEAGLYFAGMSSWFNTGTSYTSPMEQRCQNNYIILMTDGEPTQDSDSKLSSGTYINGDTIGDYDGDGKEPGSMDYLDDVAKYLYENDCNPSLGTGTSYEKQTIITYTIGFKTEQQLLQDTALHGGGQYYTANNISALSEAFEEIMANISEDNAVFVAPVVPVSRMNRTYAGNYIYVGFFKPQLSGRWLGNVKKYGLGTNGELLDVSGAVATLPNGKIKDNAQSFWPAATPDGPNVAAGGVGEVLLDQASRNLYTYVAQEPLPALTHNQNAFSVSNPQVTKEMLNLPTAAERDSLINEIHGGGRFWIMGDILHSEPAVIHYGTDATYIFAGSNDGMMHCFNDYDGSEVWGFIPPDQLGRLYLLSNTDHDYYVDGSPVVYEGSSQKILFFGERRGGNHYYALDVTTVTAPSWLYKISPVLGGETLGQSWCKPEIGEIKTSGGGSDTVFLMAGGYDTNQDAEVPSASDSVGRAVFTIKVTNGAPSSLNFSAGDMTHSIVDVSGFDSNGDGYINRVYAGDLGGNIWAFEDDDGNGTWSKRKLFSASAVDGVQRKILYAPDAAAKIYEGSIGEIIFFGTGDRADPGETDVVNRLYAVKNDWEDSATFTTLTESDLVDVTADLIQMGTDEQKAEVAEALANAKGWYIKLENAGEKVVASPAVFAGTVYFTTYTPEGAGGGDPDDPCEASEAKGTARLYAVDYLTGAAVHDYSDEVETDAEGAVVEYGKKDRSKEVGSSIPSAPVIAVLESGPKMYIGVEGGVAPEDVVPTTDMNIFYWRQVF